MFIKMSDKELLDFCQDNICEYSICQTLKCQDNCRDEDCPLVQLFERFRILSDFKSYFQSLYGTGLEVANWHENGDLESFDNFYENALEV
jgi:hypothetical protein